jgi:hypothetical protein
VKREQVVAAQLDDDLDDTILVQQNEESTTISKELFAQLTDLERYALRYSSIQHLFISFKNRSI